MTGTKEFLKDIVEMNGSSVKYGNGGKGKILGIGTLNVPGFPPLKEVLLVEGLVANLISNCQLCDDDLEVHFNKLSVNVFDSDMNCIMSGCSSSDNCYMAGKKKNVITCNSTRVEEANLWHQ